MPRNTREWARRKIDMALGNIDTAGSHLHEMQEVYKGQHPEIASNIQSFLESFAVLMNALHEFKQSF